MNKLIILLLLLAQLLSANEKMILLYVEMDYCPWCKKMDREVFDIEKNLNELQKNYTIKRVKKGNIEIPSFIKTKYYPTTYILSSNEDKLIDELPGYMKAEDYIKYLEILVKVESE